jgi:hypothetical protein
MGVEVPIQVQAQTQSVEVIKTDNAIIYVYKENGVTVIEAYSRRKRKPYDVWALHRDEKIKKMLQQYRSMLDKYHDLRLYAKAFRETIRKLEQLLKLLREQDPVTLAWFIGRLENEIEMLKRFREKLKSEAKEVRTLIKIMRRKFEYARRIAAKQFEEFEPLHALPISDWKKRIEAIVAALRTYEDRLDISNLVTFKRLIAVPPWKNGKYTKIKVTEIEKYKDYYLYMQWIEFLNELALEVFEDMLIKCLDYRDSWDTERCGEFKKPSIVKLLQAHMNSVDWSSVMQSVMLWLKVKP